VARRLALSSKPLFAALALSTGLTALGYAYATNSSEGSFDSLTNAQLGFLPMISSDTAESAQLLERYADESRRAAMMG
jgi:hypothetical protein